MKIILIGFMGSGKSSVAKKLGPLLQLPILEMDERVLQKTNTKNMHEVFEKGGEWLLRQTEVTIAQEYLKIDCGIVSTGAGVVLNKKVLDDLKLPKGNCFFLNATFQTLALRLENDTSRPLFKNRKEAQILYQFRYPLYRKYADQIIDVDTKSIDDIVKEIAEYSLKR